MKNNRATNIKIISDKLQQRTPLSKEAIEDLQNALKNIGHNPGNIDKTAGKYTAKAIESFLKTPEAQPLLSQISSWTLQIVSKYTKDIDFNRTLIKESFPPIFYAELSGAIEYAFERKDIPIIQNENLKHALKELGYLKTPEAKINQLAKGIKEYIKDNPDIEKKLTSRLQIDIDKRLQEDVAPLENCESQLFALSILGYLKNNMLKNLTSPTKEVQRQIAKSIIDYLNDRKNLDLTRDTSFKYYPYLAKHEQSKELNKVIEKTNLLEERRLEIIKTIPMAAKDLGVSSEIMKPIWGIESEYGKKLVSSTGAEGDWHFIEKTWNYIMQKYGKKIASSITKNHPGSEYKEIAKEILENKNNKGALLHYQYHPVVSTYAQASLMKNDAKVLGIDPTLKKNWVKIYSAYNIGTTDALTLIKLAQNNDPRPAVDVIGKNARHNLFFFGKKRTAKKALKEIARHLDKKHKEFYQRFRDTETVLATKPAQKENTEKPYKYPIITPISSKDDFVKRFKISWKENKRPEASDKSKKGSLKTDFEKNKTKPEELKENTKEEKIRDLIINWDKNNQDQSHSIKQNMMDTTSIGAQSTLPPPKIGLIISSQNNF